MLLVILVVVFILLLFLFFACRLSGYLSRLEEQEELDLNIKDN